MKDRITVEKVEHLPMPLIFLATAEDLALWHAEQLRTALERGEYRTAVSCFDTAPMGFDLTAAAPIIWKALTDVLREYPEAVHLTLFCGDDASYRAYCGCLESGNISHAQ